MDFNTNDDLKIKGNAAMLNERPTRKRRNKKRGNSVSKKDRKDMKKLMKTLIKMEQKENAKIQKKKGCKPKSFATIAKEKKISLNKKIK